MTLPEPNFVPTGKDKEASEANRNGPTLLHDCKNILKNPESSNGDKSYVLHQRVYVNLERESKFNFPAIVLGFKHNNVDESNSAVEVRLIDGTIRSLPKRDVYSISDVPLF